MEYHKQRSFILSSFTRQKMTLTMSIYQFTDHVLKTGWLPELDTLMKVDEQILEKYQSWMKEYN